MSDQSGGVANTAKQLFSPPMLAALRNVLSAIGPLLGMLGIIALKPDQIDHIIAIGQQIGVVIGAVIALGGLATPLVMALIAGLKSTQAANIMRTLDIARDPSQLTSTAAAQALVQATAQISQAPAAQNMEAKQALISATIAIPEVQGIVAEKHVADANPSESVVAVTEDDPPGPDKEHAADAAAAARARPLGS